MLLSKSKCVFLDRDGVLNEDRTEYLYKLEDLVIPEGVAEGLQLLKKAGFLLIVITNQAGIAKGLYEAGAVYAIHEKMQELSGNVLDALYFSPFHPAYSGNSLSRKPGSLLLEKAIAKYNIDVTQSWMIGDRERDMEAGYRAGVKTIHIVSANEPGSGNFDAGNLLEAARIILKSQAGQAFSEVAG